MESAGDDIQNVHPPRPPRDTTDFARTNVTGCRSGEHCPFLHDEARVEGKSWRRDARQSQQNRTQGPPSALGSGSSRISNDPLPSRRYAPAPVDPAQIVKKPVSEAQASNPRAFQIQQIKRRFAPQEENVASGTNLTFKISTSDPDFPFDVDALNCILHVPLEFPKEDPSIRINNPDIPRGYQINVERGFEGLVQKQPNSSLLALTNALDKNLEHFLSESKKDTIKIVPNIRASVPAKPISSSLSSLHPSQVDKEKTKEHSHEAFVQAKARRDAEIRQLEARLGRHSLFSKDHGGVRYNVPLEPSKWEQLPVPLQSVAHVVLVVPLRYPIEPSAIELPGVSPDASRQTAVAFDERVKKHSEMTLMAQLNYLATHMHLMATIDREETASVEVADIERLRLTANEPQHQHSVADRPEADDSKSHLIRVPRPPEWDNEFDHEGDSDDESDEEMESDAESEGSTHVEAPAASQPTAPSERGTALQFPQLELYGIELLETSLVYSITTPAMRQALERRLVTNAEAN
ncbi:MAG: hypothetical protein M1833_006374 [Piccolia ochrophora]|nr:MAG: hypothetical protein M1833_006374 [Piccolia ochrophora]